jgi:hypothetical protein
MESGLGEKKVRAVKGLKINDRLWERSHDSKLGTAHTDVLPMDARCIKPAL